jgi:hypothetical protein
MIEQNITQIQEAVEDVKSEIEDIKTVLRWLQALAARSLMGRRVVAKRLHWADEKDEVGTVSDVTVDRDSLEATVSIKLDNGPMVSREPHRVVPL